MTRDMTEAQFEKALKQRGFAWVDGFLPYFKDTTGRTSTHFGAICDPVTFKVLRRWTLSELIRKRRKAEKREAHDRAHAAKCRREAGL